VPHPRGGFPQEEESGNQKETIRRVIVVPGKLVNIVTG